MSLKGSDVLPDCVVLRLVDNDNAELFSDEVDSDVLLLLRGALDDENDENEGTGAFIASFLVSSLKGKSHEHNMIVRKSSNF